MDTYLKNFHADKDVFLTFRGNKAKKRDSQAFAAELKAQYQEGLDSQKGLSKAAKHRQEA